MSGGVTVFVCSSCGHEARKWAGRCPGCGGWNTILEETRTPRKGRRTGGARGADAISLVEAAETVAPRQPTGLEGVDRVLGGGRHEDAVEGRLFGQAERAVAGDGGDVVQTHALEQLARFHHQRAVAVDGSASRRISATISARPSGSPDSRSAAECAAAAARLWERF